jgi:hypothetical protein
MTSLEEGQHLANWLLRDKQYAFARETVASILAYTKENNAITPKQLQALKNIANGPYRREK